MITSLRNRLTYANVVSTLGVLLLLGAGTAIAAKQLGKKTVGAKQLKASAVTTAKIKKAAVTKAKIRDGAVDGSKLADNSVSGAKIADGSVTGADIAATSTVFSQRVARLRSTSVVPATAGAVYSLGSYTQNAGEDNQILSALDVTFSAGCAPPRLLVAYLVLNAPDPAVVDPDYIFGIAFIEDKGGGTVTQRGDFGPFPGIGNSQSKVGPPVDTRRNLTALIASAGCNGGSGIDVAGSIVDVIGTK